MIPCRLELLRAVLLGRECVVDEDYRAHVRFAWRRGWLDAGARLTTEGAELLEQLGAEDAAFEAVLLRTREAFGAQWVDVNQFLYVKKRGSKAVRVLTAGDPERNNDQRRVVKL